MLKAQAFVISSSRTLRSQDTISPCIDFDRMEIGIEIGYPAEPIGRYPSRLEVATDRGTDRRTDGLTDFLSVTWV